MQINVPVKTLLEKLEFYRSVHIDERDEARIGYRRKLREFLEKKVKFAQDLLSTIETLNSFPTEPGNRPAEVVNNESQYNTAIGMLKLHTDDTVLIGYEDYRNYVEDSWEWAVYGKQVNMSYSSKLLR